MPPNRPFLPVAPSFAGMTEMMTIPLMTQMTQKSKIDCILLPLSLAHPDTLPRPLAIVLPPSSDYNHANLPITNYQLPITTYH